MNPRTKGAASAHKTTSWTDRHVAVKIGNLVFVNIYAPNTRPDRERFFDNIGKQYSGQADALVLRGDFNCAQNVRSDR